MRNCYAATLIINHIGTKPVLCPNLAAISPRWGCGADESPALDPHATSIRGAAGCGGTPFTSLCNCGSGYNSRSLPRLGGMSAAWRCRCIVSMCRALPLDSIRRCLSNLVVGGGGEGADINLLPECQTDPTHETHSLHSSPYCPPANLALA